MRMQNIPRNKVDFIIWEFSQRNAHRHYVENDHGKRNKEQGKNDWDIPDLDYEWKEVREAKSRVKEGEVEAWIQKQNNRKFTFSCLGTIVLVLLFVFYVFFIYGLTCELSDNYNYNSFWFGDYHEALQGVLIIITDTLLMFFLPWNVFFLIRRFKNYATGSKMDFESARKQFCKDKDFLNKLLQKHGVSAQKLFDMMIIREQKNFTDYRSHNVAVFSLAVALFTVIVTVFQQNEHNLWRNLFWSLVVIVTMVDMEIIKNQFKLMIKQISTPSYMIMILEEICCKSEDEKSEDEVS